MKKNVCCNDDSKNEKAYLNPSVYNRACKNLGAMIIALCVSFLCVDAYGEDMFVLIEKQRNELVQKEEAVKKEIERLKILKKEIDEDIVKYTALLKQVEKSLEKAEDTGNKRMRHIAKAYEAMPPEDAASRLTGLDQETAVEILLKMNSKKAGLVIGMMEARKATLLTKLIAKLKK